MKVLKVNMKNVHNTKKIDQLTRHYLLNVTLFNPFSKMWLSIENLREPVQLLNVTVTLVYSPTVCECKGIEL